jgi:hypothetical protein
MAELRARGCTDHPSCAIVTVRGGPREAWGEWHFVAHPEDRAHWEILGPNGERTERSIAEHGSVTRALLQTIPGVFIWPVASEIRAVWPGEDRRDDV